MSSLRILLLLTVVCFSRARDCIVYQPFEDSELIFGDYSTGVCYPIPGVTAGQVTTVLLSLNSNCMNTKYVELKVLLSNDLDCAELDFLFIPNNDPSCRLKRRCHGENLRVSENTTTECLVRCPKSVKDEELLTVEIMYGISSLSWKLCGLQIHKVCPLNPPADSTLTSAAVDGLVAYFNLDTSGSIELMNGADLVPAKINSGVETDKAASQYVKVLGVEDACIVRPETCSPEGASLTVWLHLVDCGQTRGAISSVVDGRTGLMAACYGTFLRYYIYTTGGYYKYDGYAATKPDGWYHLAMVYNTNTSLTVYHDGSEYHGPGNSFTGGSYSTGTGELVIGRMHVDSTWTSGSVMADELSLWNRKLSAEEVQDIYTLC